MKTLLSVLLSTLEDEADRLKFTKFYNTYHVRMEQVAFHILPQRKDAEDAVQNAFMQVIKNFEKFLQIPCEELLPWIITITKNEALMIYRKNKKIVQMEDWDSLELAVEDNEPTFSLSDLIARLPETYRAAIEMKAAGYQDREIAAHLGISETAASTRISRARELLRKLAEKEGYLL